NPKSSAKVELDKFSKLIEIIGLHDYESMKLAKNLKAFYVADDLFLRKVHNNINHTNRSSNSIAILYYFYEKNTDLLLNELLNLSKGNYLFLFNSPILVHLVKQTVENHPVVGHGTSYEVLENTIRNSLDTRFMFQQYEPILLDTLNRLYELEIAGNYGYVIQRIIKSLKDYYTTYGLDSAILRGKLKLLASMNLSKQTYLETVFNKI
ncbi:MAG: hypothetical protein GWN00_27900, partial [Aliifodinibius sp.]|nr:hypothetical protein [Fodinibius sp.]NIV14628.1 hypothetical protein [Fodinibius sp.]NIY28488.1 hypothetical protein [Fodinibius sp.]